MAKEKRRLVEIMKNMSDLTPAPIEKLLMKKLMPEGIIAPRTGLEDVLLTEFSDEENEMNMEAESREQDNIVISSMSGGSISASASNGFYYEGAEKTTGKEII
jgi:hypothetical protein